MRETIGLMLIIGWLGFCVWLWASRPETFRKVFGGIEKAVDDAAGKAADALHREFKAREARKKAPRKEDAGDPSRS